ncbi:hypothetical protein L9F63_021843 [Diploptera punctata]|uniref:Fork-head domain-containing protein n=1 Tax=Diploptera punctata TaxID=6984 RepID=A0AAD8EBD4_DIPPU|nr:hypothetical protein L9F63_021843 [Diploptera punctata]
MDLYLSAQDTLSLQEMLDCDIKTEIDSVLAGTDLSLSLSELPPLDLDEALGGSGDMTMWFTSSGCLHSGNSNSSNSNFNLDFAGSDAAAMMVNPSSIMPMTLVTVPTTNAFTNINSSSSNLLITTSSSSVSSLSPVEEQTTSFSSSDASSRPEGTTSFVRTLTTTAPCGSPTQSRQQNARQQSSTTIRIANVTSQSSQNGSTSNNGLTTSLIKTVPIMSSSTKTTQPQKHLTHVQVSNVRSIPISQTSHKRTPQLNNNTKHFASDVDYDERPFPKLIAMALKNSKTGSLPVSEIYNFMCEHFPYFKTAPNGWKNSVRHNLSLNKCFEKIEKPAGNGSQRKGCLWAMNPAKIAKMDEEVQKWSKKDPMAIRKAMICPERGEMKREFSGLSKSDDDLGGSAPPTPLTPLSASQHIPEFIDINQLSAGGGTDSLDESSLTGFDIEVADGIYEELDANDEKLNLGITLTPAMPSDLITASGSISLPLSSPKLMKQEENTTKEYIEVTKRSRLNGSTIQGNYVYKPMVAAATVNGTNNVGSSRRKTPLLLRASPSASSLIKIEDP